VAVEGLYLLQVGMNEVAPVCRANQLGDVHMTEGTVVEVTTWLILEKEPTGVWARLR
jgi:hypothetical protein